MKKLIIMMVLGLAGWGCLPAQRTKQPVPASEPEAQPQVRTVPADVCYTKADSLFICRALSEAKAADIQAADMMLFFARRLMDRPYVAHTLEVNDDERLVINTRELDCTTFVENVVALTLCARSGNTDFADFVEMLRSLRYRGGKQDGYASRLHYFSDWILDKEQMGYVSEIHAPNPPFSAVQKLNVNYMSRHPQSYKALKTHPELVPVISKQERLLTGKTFPYIPKQKIDNSAVMRQAVHDGDILALTTTMEGLEISHLGLAVWKKDGLHLLNASMIHKRVVEDTQLLRDYLQKRKTATGIRVIRVGK